MEPLIRLLHAAYAAPADGVSDAELLARVAAGKDDAVFELLVRRYADLVWRVCRGVTRDHHAAEDAFQAAFLALATKAATVRGDLGGWLYRVAYHAGLKARKQRPDRQGGRSEALPDGRASVEAAELAAVLHDELNRLADAYRLPVVLCHLHGCTQAEAARRLGLPPGTVATRVRRGLARLRARLARRGVAAPVVVFAAGTAVPPRLIAAAVGPAPAEIVHLSQGALSAMTPTPWKFAAGIVVACLAGAAALTAVGRDEPARPPDPPPPAAGKRMVPVASTYAQRQQSRENLKKVGMAVHSYHDAHGHFPGDIYSEDGKPLLSWRVAILPYLDQDYLHSRFILYESWNSEHNKKLLPHAPRVYRAGDDKAGTFVKAFAGPGAGFEPGKKLTFADFQDGTSNTILAVEAGPAVPWTKPADLAYHPKQPLPAMDGPYRDRLFVVFADGFATDLRWNLDEAMYRRLIERADGQIISGDLHAPPAKPETEEEKKRAAQVRKWIGHDQQRVRELTNDRAKLIEDLDKAGAAPPAEAIPDDASIEELERERLQLERRASALRYDIERLQKELAKRKK